ncbi:ATP/GTP-binding protein [Vibrio alginolyticus]
MKILQNVTLSVRFLEDKLKVKKNKMLIDFSVQNYCSFNSRQELSMLASTSTKEQCVLNNLKEVNAFGIKSVLKSSAIFGSNGSGKSNLAESLRVMQMLVLGSLDSVGDSASRRVIPFLLKEDYFDIPSEFEITFLASGNLYRYGIAISKGEILEEWLYWTKSSRETLLFQREKQTVNYNQRSFSEAKLFTKKEGELWIIEKTKEFVPFISVLSQFNGEKSSIVTSWFEKLNVISGLSDYGFKDFTIELFENNSKFRKWSKEILKSFQIYDLEISEVEKNLPLPKRNRSLEDEELNDAITKLTGYLENTKLKQKKIDVVKIDQSTGEKYSIPLSFESEGTRKLLYLLGPLYDVIVNDEILFIDEFDNKFHTLLCKFIIDLYNKNNFGDSQLIITCHDTNLLTNELFLRDQIWFIEKNQSNESELYSLLEYKEHYTRKSDSYSKDYLSGKYGAIPLFSSVATLEEMLNGER